MKLLLPLLGLVLLAGCIAAPHYSGGPLKNFDGKEFYNTAPSDKSLWDLLRMGFGSLTQSERWPTTVEYPPQTLKLSQHQDELMVTYINHATVLIQVAGLNILTDPIYSERASPFSWAGPKRVYRPGIALHELPDIDVILISHNHYDHLDVATLKKLYERQASPPLLLAGYGNGLLFENLGLRNYRDMQWDDQTTIEDSVFHFVECRHRSGRGLADQMKTLWGSFVLETRAGNVYFAGDTGYSPHFKQQGERFGEFVLTILPIGAYEPRWFMADVHLNPEEAVQAHIDLNSEQSLAIHFGTFQLTYEGIDQPVIDLETALDRRNIKDDDFWVLSPGESRTIAPKADNYIR